MLLTAVLVLKVFFFNFIKVSGWITYRVFFEEEQLFAFYTSAGKGHYFL